MTTPTFEDEILREFDKKYGEDLLYAGSLKALKEQKVIFVAQNHWIKSFIKSALQKYETYLTKKLAYKHIQATKLSLRRQKEMIKKKLPKKDKPRLGSENADTYRNYANGFNDCLDEIITLLETV